jgi:hypothetical protein
MLSVAKFSYGRMGLDLRHPPTEAKCSGGWPFWCLMIHSVRNAEFPPKHRIEFSVDEGRLPEPVILA